MLNSSQVFVLPFLKLEASLVAQMRIYLPAMQIWVRPWAGKIPWRRQWLPTPVFLPGEFHGQRSLVGYSPWDRSLTGLSD